MVSEKESGFSKQAEATLIKQAQGGSQESLNLLLLRHEQLVHWVVQRQWLCTLPYVVAVQEGRRGLWHAILGFDPERGSRFSTYAYQAIMKYVWAGVKGEIRRIHREIPTEVLGLYFYEIVLTRPGCGNGKMCGNVCRRWSSGCPSSRRRSSRCIMVWMDMFHTASPRSPTCFGVTSSASVNWK